jgi:hypothetical protein
MVLTFNPGQPLREDAAMPTSATYVMQISQMMDGVQPVERGAQHPGRSCSPCSATLKSPALAARAHETAPPCSACAGDGATTESRSPWAANQGQINFTVSRRETEKNNRFSFGRRDSSTSAPTPFAQRDLVHHEQAGQHNLGTTHTKCSLQFAERALDALNLESEPLKHCG